MKVDDFLKNKSAEIVDTKYPIKRIKTREDDVLLYLEDEKIVVSIEDYFKYSLSKIKGINDEIYELLKDNQRLLLAKKGCLRKLSMKDYSIYQMKEFLKKKELSHEEKENLINELIRYGLLDDEKYCKNRIQYLSNSNLSNKQIQLKLKKEGISQELIQSNLSSDYQTEYKKALALGQKYVHTIHNKSYNATKNAVLMKLVNSGFSYDISNEVLQNIEMKENNDQELLNKEYLKAFKKYCKKYDKYELYSKIYAYLMSKGFQNEDIKKVLSEL